MKNYPIATIDPIETLTLERPSSYGVKRTLDDGREFVYCYTALTSLVKGGTVAINQDTGDAAGQNPRATVPATSSVANRFGVAAETVTAAGGIWVQTYGRCTYARVDGGTDVGINDPLKPVNAKQYLTQDHADTGTASMFAVAESVEADAVAAQTDTTNGDADKTIFILGELCTVA
jgi:hypothetical protein